MSQRCSVCFTLLLLANLSSGTQLCKTPRAIAELFTFSIESILQHHSTHTENDEEDDISTFIKIYKESNKLEKTKLSMCICNHTKNEYKIMQYGYLL